MSLKNDPAGADFGQTTPLIPTSGGTVPLRPAQPLSVPFAIASYNEGEGGLNENLKKALEAAKTSNDPERSFWTLVEHAEILSVQFKNENIKYVPKFFAAAIVGENPRVFGVDMGPISSYTQPQSNVAADQ